VRAIRPSSLGAILALSCSSTSVCAQVQPQWQPLYNLLEQLKQQAVQKAEQADSQRRIDSGESSPAEEQQRAQTWQQVNQQINATNEALQAQIQRQRQASAATSGISHPSATPSAADRYNWYNSEHGHGTADDLTRDVLTDVKLCKEAAHGAADESTCDAKGSAIWNAQRDNFPNATSPIGAQTAATPGGWASPTPAPSHTASVVTNTQHGGSAVDEQGRDCAQLEYSHTQDNDTLWFNVVNKCSRTITAHWSFVDKYYKGGMGNAWDIKPGGQYATWCSKSAGCTGKAYLSAEWTH
jgi:hypothetical protein